jgi:hypothetical protein
VIENERDPISGGLSTASSVDASPEDFGQHGEDNGQGDQDEYGAGPRIVIVQEELNPTGHVGSDVQHEQAHQKKCQQRVTTAHGANRIRS